MSSVHAMKFPRPTGVHVVSLTVGLLCVSTLCGSQSTIQCPADRGVRLEDGQLEYDTLPPTEAPGVDMYSPQGLAGWYDMARGFVNVVQEENLPYDVIEDTINENNLQCSVGTMENCDEDEEGGSFDIQATLRQFGEWWAPLIGVTVFGGILAFLFAIVGSIFWCCRCCGNCGGGRGMEEPHDRCMLVITILLVLVTLLLFVGVVLSFYSNQQSYDSIESLRQSVEEISDTAVGYVGSILDEGDLLFCQFIQVTDYALDETESLNSSLNDLIDDLGVQVDLILEKLDDLSTGINDTTDILENIMDTTQSLQNDSVNLQTSLDNVVMNVDNLRTQCVATLGNMAPCTNIPPSSQFATEANFSALPDVSDEFDSVTDALNGIDLTGSIEQGRTEFDTITADIQTEIDSNLGGLDGGANSSGVLSVLSEANATIFRNRDRIVSNIRRVIQNNQSIDSCPSLEDIVGGNVEDSETSVGFFRECYVNQAFEIVEQYDVYRYAFGIIICCLSLVIVVLTGVGIILGVVGWRKERSPDNRTKFSHCGGIILLISVGMAFFFGFVILILSALAFFFGSNLQKICQAIEPPQYEVFARVVDNSELWGDSLVGTLLFDDSDQMFFISGALKSCDANEAIYTAFNLSALFNIRNQLLNRTDVFGDLRTDLDEALNSVNFTTDSFLNNDTQQALNNFQSSSVESINITAFREQLEANILAFNITSTISTLENLRDNLNSIGQNMLANDAQTIITDLVDIRDNQIPMINSDVDLLETEIDGLSMHIDNVVMNTSDVVDEINGVITNITGTILNEDLREIILSTLDTLEYYIDSFLNHTANSIEREVGRCRPLSSIYAEAHSVVCQESVDGLNGYWWSLGFCAVLFIPLIVLAVLASTHYLRQNQDSDDGDREDKSYPMKSF